MSLSAFCERLAVTSKVPCDEIKKLVISATNGGGNIHRGALREFLDGMLKESLNMAEMEAAMNLADYGMMGEPKITLAILPVTLGAGFLAAWPYNYWRLKKHGKCCH